MPIRRVTASEAVELVAQGWIDVDVRTIPSSTPAIRAARTTSRSCSRAIDQPAEPGRRYDDLVAKVREGKS